MTAGAESGSRIKRNIDRILLWRAVPSRHDPHPIRNLDGLKLVAIFLYPVLIFEDINLEPRRENVERPHGIIENSFDIDGRREQCRQPAFIPESRICPRLTENRFLVAGTFKRIVNIDRDGTVRHQHIAERIGVFAGKPKSK